MRRNRLIALLLIALFAAPLVVTTIRYQQARYAVRKAVKQQMIAGINPDQLMALVFHKAEIEKVLRWEHGHEFEYRGQMFDVVSTTSSADSVRYLCWPDHHETRLNRRLTQLVNMALGSHPVNKTNQILLHDFLTKLFPPPTSGDLTPASRSTGHWLLPPARSFRSRNLDADSPPPRLG